VKKLYEAMFIIDSNRTKEGYEAAEEQVKALVTRQGGTVVATLKWDDRRLAYEINDAKRGTYILVHFEAEGDTCSKIERQVQMSEDILRVLITIDEDGVECQTASQRERAEAALSEDN